MHKTLLGTALVLASTPVVAADYLAFSHRGPGFGVCRSFISISGRGDVPHWSEIFATTASGYDLKVPFEEFIKRTYSGAGHIYSGACFKKATDAAAQELRNDSMYAKVAISTGWRPGSSRGQSTDDSEAQKATDSSSPKKKAATPVTLPPPVARGPTPNQLKYQRELEAHKARLAEIEQIKARTASKHASDRAAAERQLARHREERAVADAAQRRYREDPAQHQRTIKELENASGNCRLVRESANNGPFATEAEAIARTVSRIPSDGRQVGAPTTSWLNVALGENGRRDFKPGQRGYMASVPYERRICFGKAASGSAR